MKRYLPIVLMLFAACTQKPVIPYVVSKVYTSGLNPVLSVQIESRLNETELLTVSAEIKKANANYAAFKINYLLPGTMDKYPDVSGVYASVEYPEPLSDKNFTNKDTDGNRVNLEILGISAGKAKYMLSLNPPDAAGKTILGKFVDDYTNTVSIIYADKQKDETYILELDTAGKVVSAVVPTKIRQSGVEKLVISQNGDYVTLKDSILTMYSSDDLTHAFRKVKEGI